MTEWDLVKLNLELSRAWSAVAERLCDEAFEELEMCKRRLKSSLEANEEWKRNVAGHGVETEREI